MKRDVGGRGHVRFSAVDAAGCVHEDDDERKLTSQVAKRETGA